MKVVWVSRIAEVPAAQWDALVDPDMPFLQHAFLDALESSGSVGLAQGWEPLHACVWEGDELLAAAPGYLKSHSYGEYVFDWSWADAYARHGLHYYPKYVNAIPFTPVVGQRLLMRDKHQNDAEKECSLFAHYREATLAMLAQRGCSSWHILFSAASFASQQMLLRQGTQFHFYNKGYASFDDFLAQLSSSRRKSIRKERRRLQQAGYGFVWRDGGALSAEERAHVYRCYSDTYLKRGQQPYLSADFFQLIWQAMPTQTQVLLVHDADERPVAMALFFVGVDTLYGRYWGCIEEVSGLHFETCYYQGMDRCIALGLTRFDAGAQGEHKLLRGFEPVTTHSFHWLSHPGFAEAVAEFVAEEAQHVAAYQQQARECLPFRKSC